MAIGALLLLGLATPSAGAASTKRSLRSQLVTQLRPLPRLTTKLGRKVSRESRRRSLGQAKRALRAARRGDLCRVLVAVGLIDHVGAAGSRLRKVERLLRRAKLGRRCRDRGHRGVRKRARLVSGGAPGSGIPKRSPPASDQGGEDFPQLPIGPYRPRKGGRGRPTDAEGVAAPEASGASRAVAPAFSAKVTDPVSVFRSTSIGAPTTPSTGDPLDPSTASAGNVVLVSGNRYLAISTDGGRTFTYRNPIDIYSTSDPASLKNPDGGACCDQVLQYDAATDRFYWLLQYWCTVQSDCKKRPGQNRLRLAVASPKDVADSGGTRWRFWDLTSDDFGIKGNWLDFPDLAIGRNFLYLTVNSPSKNAAFFARFRKRALRDGNLDWWYHRYDNQYILKPVQNVRATGFAVRRKSTSELELWRWPESTRNTFSDTIPIETTPTQDCSAKSPDGQDFLAFQGCGGFSASLSGAAMEGSRGNGRIWTAWTSGKRLEGTKNKDGSDKLDGTKQYDQSHIEIAVLSGTRRTLDEQQTIWNPKYAYAYPYLAGGPSGEVVMTYMAGGGGTQYPGWGVGFLTNRRSLVRVVNGTAGAGRVGDYLAVRPAWPSRTLWEATGNVRDAAGYLPYYALFGRRGDRPILTRPIDINRPPPVFGFADLVVDSLKLVNVNGVQRGQVVVRNAGNVAASKQFFVNVGYADPNHQNQLVQFDVPSLAAGATSAPYTFDCLPATSGLATATVDATGQITESNEANNTLVADLQCPSG